MAYVLMPTLRDIASKNDLPPLSGTAAWLALAVTSYMAGHLIFLLGSFSTAPTIGHDSSSDRESRIGHISLRPKWRGGCSGLALRP